MWSFRESAAPPPLLTSLRQLAWALPFKACEAQDLGGFLTCFWQLQTQVTKVTERSSCIPGPPLGAWLVRSGAGASPYSTVQMESGPSPAQNVMG